LCAVGQSLLSISPRFAPPDEARERDVSVQRGPKPLRSEIAGHLCASALDSDPKEAAKRFQRQPTISERGGALQHRLFRIIATPTRILWAIRTPAPVVSD